MKSDLFSLTNKVVVIIGSTGLLGRQHADAVAAYGGIPVLLDLQTDQVGILATELNDAYGVEAVGYAVDITQEDQIADNCKQLIEHFGRIDALINNAANNPKVENSDDKNFSRLEHFPMEIWNEDLAVGLTGAFLCAKHYGTAISKNPHRRQRHRAIAIGPVTDPYPPRTYRAHP